MGRFSDHERFQQLLSVLKLTGGVSKCLYYPGMAQVPAGYDRFAGDDSRKMGFDWTDACPAYALALVSHGGYTLPNDDQEMEVLWDELGGGSTKLWSEVRDVVIRSWDWLEVHSSKA
jgi:hypothetical protein